jgi:hypothetical protein
MTEAKPTSEEIAALTKQVDDLNTKVTTINDKLDKNAEDTAALLIQTRAVLTASNATRSQDIMRQTIASPTGLIAKEATTYILKALQKNQKSKTQQWLMTSGHTVVEKAIEGFIMQKLPQVNWYGTNAEGTETQDNYHIKTFTNFPVEINTGVPFVGKVALARVGLDVECDVNPKTNQTSNVVCHISSADPNRGLFTSIKEDFVTLVKPHKTLWSILRPIGLAIGWLSHFMRSQTNFSIPFLIFFLITMFIYARFFPAFQIWTSLLHYQTPYWGLFGIRPINILFGLVNGIFWGALFWLVIRFKLLPGLGKVISFTVRKIFPAIQNWFMNPYKRWGTVAVAVAIIAVVILWRVGVFEPPPALAFTSVNIPNGRAASLYQYSLKVQGGNPPYVAMLDNTTVPTGLVYDPITGNLSGTPGVPGTYTLKFEIKDSSKTANVINPQVKLNISPANSLIILYTELPEARLGKAYSSQIVTVGGVGQLRWGFVSGTLPPGINLDTRGMLAGTPLKKGLYVFTVTVGDSSGAANYFNQTYSMTVK